MSNESNQTTPKPNFSFTPHAVSQKFPDSRLQIPFFRTQTTNPFATTRQG